MDQETANKLFTYNPRTGEIRNRINRGQRAIAGDVCGYLHPLGYNIIRHKGKAYQSHRIIWLMVYGEYPKNQIDHINGVRDDNRINNLREATQTVNMRNMKRPKDNTSGVIGVYYNRKQKEWRARINAKGEREYLGAFKYFIVACAIRKSAEIEYGYHENHGRNQ